tara:strand:- start:347 stop:751 length:405 start_codon:yes stop_codon:yes gene_type:complete
MLSGKSILKTINGDASFRSFYRKTTNKKNSIIVYATKEKEKNLLIYDAINSLLNANNVVAPKLYKENYKKNFIEIQDFGDDTVFKLLKKVEVIKLIYTKNLLTYLIKFKKLNREKLKISMGRITKFQFIRVINY